MIVIELTKTDRFAALFAESEKIREENAIKDGRDPKARGQTRQ